MSGTSAFILENQQQKDLCSLFCVNLHLNIYIICLFCNKFSHEKEASSNRRGKWHVWKLALKTANETTEPRVKWSPTVRFRGFGRKARCWCLYYLSYVRYFLLWLYHRCELMLFRMGKVSRELWLYLGPAWKRFVNGDCIFFFCLLNHTGLPNHREITVWEIRRSLMCLKTLSKSGVRIYKLFFALHLYLLLFIFHVPYQEKKQEKTFSTSWCP